MVEFLNTKVFFKSGLSNMMGLPHKIHKFFDLRNHVLTYSLKQTMHVCKCFEPYPNPLLQQNMPGMDFKGNRHDQNRIQPGMQQLEVSLVAQGRYSFRIEAV